jgi:putative ABC transport system permease protein
MSDLRLAFRQLLKQPGFTAVAVLSLALGIGATTAIYSVVHAALLNPVPGPEADRLVQIGERLQFGDSPPRFGGVAPPALTLLRTNQDAFAEFTWCKQGQLERKTDDFLETVHGAWVAPNFFTHLGVRPALGRSFAGDEAAAVDKDGQLAADTVIVLSHALWMSDFGGQPDAIGRSLEMSGRHFTVVGVMPPHFRFPGGDTQFWVPLEDPRVWRDRVTAPNYLALARLKDGTSLEQMRVALETWAGQLRAEYATDNWQGKSGYGAMTRLPNWTLEIRPLREMFTSEKLQQTLSALLVAIVFVLLITCANVANLMLARTERRQHELAIRAALGAGRFRVMRQMLTESVLLAVLGGLCGLLVTWWGMKLLVALLPPYMPQLNHVGVDPQLLGFALVLSLGTGLVFGLAPALRALRVPLGEMLKDAGTRTTSGAGWRHYRDGLVVVEVALSLVLLVGAGLMVHSMIRLLKVEPGFDPDNLLEVHVHLPLDRYLRDRVDWSQVMEQLHEQLAALPGVEAVGIGKDDSSRGKYLLEDRGRVVELTTSGRGVGEGDLFRAMRVPLLAGRTFERSDIGSSGTAVVINESMALACWPGQNPLGKKFSTTTGRTKRQFEVVGVVGVARPYGTLSQDVNPTFFRPFHDSHLLGAFPHLAVRTRTDPAALIPAIRKVLKAVEPDMRTPRIGIVRENLYRSSESQRTYMMYLVGFAGVGLFLSALGIYGVLAYSVARRTREIGIRMAVGAGRGDVLRMVMGEGGRLAGMGIILGLVAAAGLTRFLQNQIFGISPTEPVVFVSVVAFLLLIAMLACLLPARRAANIDPMDALRHE